MTSASKQKGSSYERTVSKYLSKTYNESFVRVVNSGAYVGGKNVIRKTHLSEAQVKSFKGDITPPDSWKHFNCECKSYLSFSFHLLLKGKYAQLDEWLEQMLEVEEENDVSILFMKFNRIGQYVAVPAKFTWKSDCFYFYKSSKYGDWIVMEFDHFFALNTDLLKTYCQ